jgi:pimeloyl-ACP methyl ester carboxylesterase
MKLRFIELIRYFYLVILLAAAVNVWGQTSNTGAEKTVPRFETSTCAVQVPDGIKAVCGNLFVKENRQKSESRTIRLSVIIIKSTSTQPLPDPVFYTGGGPGGSSLGRARNAGNLVPFTRDRDFIIFEQRGTRFAEPSLQCPEVNNAIHQSWSQNLNIKQSIQKEVGGAKLCRERLRREGVDLSAYDSAASAADMEALRRVLGINQWNLYGISYSTRLMLNYIREYGQNVRSVILDSVLPPTVNWDESDVDNILRSLNLLFENCARDAKCSAAYPKLKENFFTVLKSANKEPVVIEAVKDGKPLKIKIDGNTIFDFIYNLLEDNGELAGIPSIIDAFSRGKYENLKPYIEGHLTSQGFIWGMRYSVWCREEMPFQNQSKILAQSTRYRELKGFKVQGAFPEICRVWKVPAAAIVENQPVKSNIPALIFSGEYDPDTPPAWGKLVASWFPNSFFYEVKNATHGAINNRCTFVDITASFINDPSVRPNDKCLSEIQPMNFK